MAGITLLDMLKNAGLINQQQFDEALKNRVLFGGKIGTNLIELGYIKEDDLARFLSSKLAVPFVDPRRLLAIPPDIIGRIPRELALKYKAIPIQLDKKKLYLVMADPADLKAIDEIAFITGFIIKPLVAPEVRLIQALGKYYHYEIDYRYRHIIDRIDRQIRSRPLPPVAEPVSAPEVVVPDLTESPSEQEEFFSLEEEPAPVREELPLLQEDIFSSLKEFAPAPAAKMPQAAASPSETVAVAPDAEPELEEAEIIDDEEWLKRVDHYSIDTASTTLSRAEDREEIATILMGCLAQEFSRVALFVVRGDAACGWKGVKRGVELKDFDRLVIPFHGPSVLKTVAQGAGYYLGVIPDTPMNLAMIDGLGGGKPKAALLLPLIILGRVVNVLYLEGGEKALGERFDELQRLLFKVSLSFEILIFREKILML